MSRLLLGILALLFLGGGLVAMAVDGAAESGWLTGAVAVRVGAVLGVLWLALPDIRRTSPRVVLVVGTLAVVVMVRPRLILIALPAALVIALLVPRKRSRSRPPR